jgi:hypothetical protein
MLDRWKRRERAYIDAGGQRQLPDRRRPALRWSDTSLSSLIAGGIALVLLTAPNADIADCGHAADAYSVAVAKVLEALRSYGKCIAASSMRDNCAAEMQALDDAHDNFVDALGNAKGCR